MSLLRRVVRQPYKRRPAPDQPGHPAIRSQHHIRLVRIHPRAHRPRTLVTRRHQQRLWRLREIMRHARQIRPQPHLQRAFIITLIEHQPRPLPTRRLHVRQRRRHVRRMMIRHPMHRHTRQRMIQRHPEKPRPIQRQRPPAHVIRRHEQHPANPPLLQHPRQLLRRRIPLRIPPDHVQRIPALFRQRPDPPHT